MNDRLTELQSRAAAAGIDAVLLLHHRDVLYYANTVRPAALLLTPTGATLFVRRGLEPARAEATVARVVPMRSLREIGAALTEAGYAAGTLGTELDLVAARLYRRLQETFPDWALVDISPLVLAQRAVKEAEEVEAVRQAAVIADAGHQAAGRTIAPGVSELAVAAEVECAMRHAGHEGFQPLRYPEARGAGVLLMSGEHLTVRGGHGLVVTGAGLSPAMPYGPSRRRLRPGDAVVVDIGATWQGYTADESRTFTVGPASAAQKALFAVALAVEETVLAALRPGVKAAALYPIAEEIVARGAPPHFPPGSLTLPGFVGHGLGLEIDEPPVLWPRDKGVIREGMVLAVEVEVSAPAQGTMVKLEDTVVVRGDGGEVLTTAPPRELWECG